MVTLQVTIQVRCSTFHRASRLCASGCTLSLHHSHESTCALCVERVANNNREGRAGKSGRCRRCPSRKPLGSAPGDGQAATAEVQTRLRDLQSTSPTLPQCAPQERALRAPFSWLPFSSIDARARAVDPTRKPWLKPLTLSALPPVGPALSSEQAAPPFSTIDARVRGVGPTQEP